MNEALIKKNILTNPKNNIVRDINYKNFIVSFQSIKGLQSKDLREIVDTAKKENNNILIFVFSEYEEKLSLAVGVSGSCFEKYDSSVFAKKISILINGSGGGGRKDFAQAGWNVQKNLDGIFNFILEEINKIQ